MASNNQNTTDLNQKLLSNPAVMSIVRKMMDDLKAEGRPITAENLEQEIRERIAFAELMMGFARDSSQEPGEAFDSLKAQAVADGRI